MKKKTKPFFVHLPEDMQKKIAEIAERECRTQASVARQAIKEFLERRENISKDLSDKS